MIIAEHLSKSFGHTAAVSDLSLHVGASEIYGLVGPDGAGKTTTIRLLCGALRPDSLDGGQHPVVTIGGQDMLRHTDLARTQIGYLPQRFSMYGLTVLENLRFFCECAGWQPVIGRNAARNINLSG
jgi:ABC-2 type transport system ATP-binding protein